MREVNFRITIASHFRIRWVNLLPNSIRSNFVTSRFRDINTPFKYATRNKTQ